MENFIENFKVTDPNFDEIKSRNKIIRKGEFEKVKKQLRNLIKIQNKRVDNYKNIFLEEIKNYQNAECVNYAKAEVRKAISNIQNLRKEIKDGIDYAVKMLDKYQDKIPPNIEKIPLAPSLIKQGISSAKDSAKKFKSSDELNNVKELKYKGMDLGFITKKTLQNADKKLKSYFTKTKNEFEKFGVGTCDTVSKMKDVVKSTGDLMELKSPEKDIDESLICSRGIYSKYSHSGFIYNYCKVISSIKRVEKLDQNMEEAIIATAKMGKMHGNNFVEKIWSLVYKFKNQNMPKAKELYQACYDLKPMELWGKRKEVVSLGKELYDKWSKIGIDVLNNFYVIDGKEIENIMNQYKILDEQKNFDTLMLVVAGNSAGQIAPEIDAWIKYGERTLDEILSQQGSDQNLLSDVSELFNES